MWRQAFGHVLSRGARGRAKLLLCACIIVPSIAIAEDDSRLSGVLGAASKLRPQYSGSDQQATTVTPLIALRYGRFRIASSSAGAILAFNGDAAVAGASADLVSGDKVRFGVALRIDEGRRSTDAPELAGLPDVRRTVRGRLYTSLNLTRHWSLGGGISQDLLGRQGGAFGSLELGYHDRLTPRTEWSAGVGLTAADRRYMRTWYGIGETAAAATGMSAYDPQGGLRDVYTGAGLMTALTPQWIGFVSGSVSSLQGSAANSPLTHARNSYAVAVGLGYRWKP